MIASATSDVSICVFGSSARATNDAISDRDVLIVANDIASTKDIVAEWTKQGWSVSLYSRKRLRNVAKIGSLFVKHLQLEGIVLSDPSGWLSKILEEFCVKQSYYSEIADALDLALPLQRLKGVGIEVDQALAADIGYVFLRNYAIYRCAEQQTYLFDYRALLEELQGIEKFSDRCRSQLMRLRIGKHIYRSGNLRRRDLSGLELVTDCLEEACSNLTLNRIEQNTPVRFLATPYSTLRDCEAALVSNGLFNTNRASMPYPLKKIWKMIRNPKDYSWDVSRIDETWVARSNKVIAGLNSTTSSDVIVSDEKQRSDFTSLP